MFMISTSNRFAVLGKNNVKKTYLAAAICGLVKEKERKAAMRRYVKTHPEVATRILKIKHRSAKAERETLHERRAERTQRREALRTKYDETIARPSVYDVFQKEKEPAYDLFAVSPPPRLRQVGHAARARRPRRRPQEARRQGGLACAS